MSVYKGKKIKVRVIGESHGDKIRATISGLKGFSFDLAEVTAALDRRSPKGKSGATARVESDTPVIKGVKNGKIIGSVTADFYNRDVKSGDYANLYGIPRPSHADIGRYYKYGEVDFTGGGEFSGRATVGLCFVGAICKDILEKYYSVTVTAYLSAAGDKFIKSYDAPSVAGVSEAELGEYIERVKSEGDSLGGRVECIIENCPKGLGGSLFDGLEGKIAALVFAIPSVKGVEFGRGFGLCKEKGSQANDEPFYDGAELDFATNSDGGIYGGVSCGRRITFAVAFKPTPSIAKEQNTVNLLSGENVKISVKGRHDCCAALRAAPIVEAVAAIAVLDEILYEND